MAANMDGGLSLLRGTRDEGASFSLMFFVSALLHLFFFASVIFAPVPAPKSDFLSGSSVINVSMVTLPAAGSPSQTGEKAEENNTQAATPEPGPVAEPEVQEQAVPEPEPAPEPEPVAEPEPEPVPQAQVAEPEKPKAAVALEPEKPKPPEKPEIVKKEPEKPKVVKKEPVKPEATVKKTEEPVKHKKPDQRVANSKKSRSSSVEEAIDKIRRKVGTGEGKNESSSKNGAVAKKGNAAGAGGAPGAGGGIPGNGFGPGGRGNSAALEFYKQNVIPDRINKNWAISEHLLGRRFGLEAIMVIKIMPDGQIADFWFEKRSGDRYLDESAERAVRKADPLPPLPGDFTGPYYEVGLRFTPSGLN